MFTSAADVFRSRQVIADLTAYIVQSGRNSFCRITPGTARLESLFTTPATAGGSFRFPRDRDIYGEVLLASALPDDDFPAFTTATALLLLDRIRNGAGEDDLYWNWDAFSDHYRLADPSIRAVIMNGFRTAAAMGCVSISVLPETADCLTLGKDAVLVQLRRIGDVKLIDVIERDATAEEAAELWRNSIEGTLSPERVNGFRYLYERPKSMAPVDPHGATLIPWMI